MLYSIGCCSGNKWVPHLHISNNKKFNWCNQHLRMGIHTHTSICHSYPMMPLVSSHIWSRVGTSPACLGWRGGDTEGTVGYEWAQQSREASAPFFLVYTSRSMLQADNHQEWGSHHLWIRQPKLTHHVWQTTPLNKASQDQGLITFSVPKLQNWSSSTFGCQQNGL